MSAEIFVPQPFNNFIDMIFEKHDDDPCGPWNRENSGPCFLLIKIEKSHYASMHCAASSQNFH